MVFTKQQRGNGRRQRQDNDLGNVRESSVTEDWFLHRVVGGARRGWLFAHLIHAPSGEEVAISVRAEDLVRYVRFQRTACLQGIPYRLPSAEAMPPAEGRANWLATVAWAIVRGDRFSERLAEAEERQSEAKEREAARAAARN